MNTISRPLLPRVTINELISRDVAPVDDATRSAAEDIVRDVRARGAGAVREYAARFNERADADPLVLDRDAMRLAFESLDADTRGLLLRVADRIARFASAQRDAIGEFSMTIPGGAAGHTVEPIQSAGCYAPAGRYPLPSSALMTAITARIAGCERVVVASPGAQPIMLAAAHVARADTFLAVGGAHGVAALAYGIDECPPCDIIVGPGNRWVTAAKQCVMGAVGIDMLAGPSELLILADENADASVVAADLLAQAEHDVDAVPILVTTSAALLDDVERELETQLELLPTRDTAIAALRNGGACLVADESRLIRAADAIAPEHLEILTRDPFALSRRIQNAGAVFLGASAAEVLGDYGAGPNHTLPTGRSARFQAGLSVKHFLRLRTWLRIDDPVAAAPLAADAQQLAEIEGLAAHAAAASRRIPR